MTFPKSESELPRPVESYKLELLMSTKNDGWRQFGEKIEVKIKTYMCLYVSFKEKVKLIDSLSKKRCRNATREKHKGACARQNRIAGVLRLWWKVG